MVGIPSSSNSHGARRLSARCALALLAAVVFLFTSAAHAGRYELVKGQGVEVCEAYEKNLNASYPKEPMLCEREIHPQFKDFTKPKWKEINLAKNKRLLWSVFSVFHPTVVAQTPPTISDDDVDRAIKKWINLSSQRLYQTQVDMDNDGRIENILLYNDGLCGLAQFAYASPLLVQYENEPRADHKKTDLLLQNTWRDPQTGEVKRDIAYYNFNMYSLFQYKNITYFDKVSARSNERDKLNVYRVSHNRTTQMCQYRFVGNGN